MPGTHRPHTPADWVSGSQAAQRRLNTSPGWQPGDLSPQTTLLIRGLGPASEDVGPRLRIRWAADAQGSARSADLGLEIRGLPSIQRAPTPPPCATVSPNSVLDEPAYRSVNPTPPGPRPANPCDLGLAAKRRPDVSPGCRRSRNPGYVPLHPSSPERGVGPAPNQPLEPHRKVGACPPIF